MFLGIENTHFLVLVQQMPTSLRNCSSSLFEACNSYHRGLYEKAKSSSGAHRDCLKAIRPAFGMATEGLLLRTYTKRQSPLRVLIGDSGDISDIPGFSSKNPRMSLMSPMSLLPFAAARPGSGTAETSVTSQGFPPKTMGCH